LDFKKMPLVIQFNKRDLEDIVSEQDLLDRWSPSGLPIVMSSALHGHGVRRTLQHLLNETYRYLDDCFALSDKYRLDVTHFTGMLPG
jgi:signal recognition particle receptor subunit beta